MKKRTKIIIILLVAFIALFFYGSKNFENDKNHLLHIKTLAANGNVLDAFNEMEENQSFTNPVYRQQKVINGKISSIRDL